MATSKSTWVRAERSAAALFGALRRPLSGSSNRDDQGTDDAIHPVIYLESKLREAHAAWTLWRQVNMAARKVGKVPVVSLREKHAKGELLVIHSGDLAAVVVEWLRAQDDDTLIAIEHEVREGRA